MIALCREKDWVLDITQDVIDAHAFDEPVSQPAARTTSPPWLDTAQPMSEEVVDAVAPIVSAKRRVLADISDRKSVV